MVTKMKAKFIPTNYELELFKMLQNLKQKDMTVKYCIEEFYKLTIQSRYRELSKEKVARYINGLRFNIQDEVGMLNIYLVEDSYQYALRAEGKWKRKNQGSSQGKEKYDYSIKDKSTKDEPKPIDQRQRMGQGEFKGTCFKCHEEGHRAYECPQKDGDRRATIVDETEDQEPKQGA